MAMVYFSMPSFTLIGILSSLQDETPPKFHDFTIYHTVETRHSKQMCTQKYKKKHTRTTTWSGQVPTYYIIIRITQKYKWL